VNSGFRRKEDSNAVFWSLQILELNFLAACPVFFGQAILRVPLYSSRSVFQSAKSEQPFLLCCARTWLPKYFLEQYLYFLHCVPCAPLFLHTDACSYVLLDRFLIRTFNFANACITRNRSRLRRVRCPFSSLIYFAMSIHPSFHIWRYSPFRALASLIRRLNSPLFSSLLLHPLIPSIC